jgi:hypothetical protein
MEVINSLYGIYSGMVLVNGNHSKSVDLYKIFFMYWLNLVEIYTVHIKTSHHSGD